MPLSEQRLSKIIYNGDESDHLLNEEGNALLLSAALGAKEDKSADLYLVMEDDPRRKLTLATFVVNSIDTFSIPELEYKELLAGTYMKAKQIADMYQQRVKPTEKDNYTEYAIVDVSIVDEDYLMTAASTAPHKRGSLPLMNNDEKCYAYKSGVKVGGEPVTFYIPRHLIKKNLGCSGIDIKSSGIETLGYGGDAPCEKEQDTVEKIHAKSPDKVMSYQDIKQEIVIYQKMLNGEYQKVNGGVVSDGRIVEQFGFLIHQLSLIVDANLKHSEDFTTKLEEVSHNTDYKSSDDSICEKYGLVPKQVSALLQTCDALNAGELSGTGIQAVPIWFHDQFNETMALNVALQEEAQAVQMSIEHLGKNYKPEDLIDLPERQSLITGNKTIYIPGVTGPKVGDEHLDPEYNHAVRARSVKGSKRRH